MVSLDALYWRPGWIPSDPAEFEQRVTDVACQPRWIMDGNYISHGGEIRRSPDPDICTDAEWSSYVFNRSGSPGVKYEWWCHIASGFWFIALRDTARDIVVETFPAEAARRGLPP